MDRKDGTGKAHRGDRKGGNTRGGWEGKNEETKGADGAPVEEQKRAPRREKTPEPVEEEEEVGYTLDDYFTDKQAKSSGVLGSQKEARKHEKIQDKVQDKDGDKFRVTTINNVISHRDAYAVRAVENANLMGFQAPVEVDFDERRGAGRGGRGDRREPREPRQTGGRRGGRGGKLVVDDEAFPAL